MGYVEIRDLQKIFGEVHAVDGVNLSVEPGEFLVLLGPSGCGKTTLMRMIAGLETPTSGEISIDGELMDEDVPPRVRNVAMVFQSYALYPHKKAFANIAFPLEALRTPRSDIDKRVRATAELFGIGALLDRFPREMSGGERQRVALARAVVRSPKVFLFDEPLSNLDARQRSLARVELKQLQRRLGATIVYVTHDQVEAMGLGDRIAVMNHGRVHQIAPPATVYDDPADTFVASFLGAPPMNIVKTDTQTSLGFRPERFLPRSAFGTSDDVVPFRFCVSHVEFLGSDRLVYGSLDDHLTEEPPVIATLPTTVTLPIVDGQVYDFAVERRMLRYFDRVNGMRSSNGAA